MSLVHCQKESIVSDLGIEEIVHGVIMSESHYMLNIALTEPIEEFFHDDWGQVEIPIG